jgi:hypothetical protein
MIFKQIIKKKLNILYYKVVPPMSFERVTAFCLYLSDNMDLIRTPGMTPDQAYDIAEREWKDLINNNKDIASEYIKKEISIITRRASLRVHDNTVYHSYDHLNHLNGACPSFPKESISDSFPKGKEKLPPVDSGVHSRKVQFVGVNPFTFNC